jgi:DNA excision repair protein ERCC-4
MEPRECIESKGSGSVTRLVADDREQESPVLGFLRDREDVRIEVRRLKAGDYEVGGKCLIERKTVADFARSLVDGRLFRQAYRLRGTGWPCAVILEGRLADLGGIQVRRESLQGAMITLSLVHQIPVFRALDAEETARLLVYAGRQLEREEMAGVPKAGRRCTQRRRAQLMVLQALPGIGPKRARLLLERFGSVKGVVNASEEDLGSVRGLGPSAIGRMRWATGDA